MKNILRPVILLFFIISNYAAFGQAPTLSYPASETYVAGTAISPLKPTSTGVAAPAYSATPTILGSGFSQPAGVAVDAAGNIYVASYGSNQVFKIPVGNGTPVAIGSGFYEPNDVKVDAAGNVYVADQGNSAVKEIPVGGGSIITIGSGFSYPSAIALDKAGNVYVADPGNGLVKKVPANGLPIVNLGSFNNPFGVTVDGQGIVYASDATFKLYEIPPGGGAFPVLLSGLNNPNGIWADPSGNIFVTDSNNGLVKMLPAGGGALVTLPVNFNDPFEVTTDATGNVIVGDPTLTYIQKFNITGGYTINPTLPEGLLFNSNTGVISGTPTANGAATTYTITAWNASGSKSATVSIKINLPAAPLLTYATPKSYVSGSPITPLAPTTTTRVSALAYSTAPVVLGGLGFLFPEGLALDAAGNTYVADAGHNLLKKIPAGGGTPVTIASGFNLISDVAVDKSGNVYVTDELNNQVKEFVGGSGSPVILGAGSFSHPFGIAVDAAGNVYVAEPFNAAVKKIPAGNKPVVLIASGGGIAPNGVCVDAAGNVYFADANNAIKKIPVGGGAPVTIATDLNTPLKVAVDVAGNLFVAESGNNSIKEIYAGTNTSVTISAGFNYPLGICVDAKGDIFASDYGNDVIKEIKPWGGYFINALPPGLSFSESTGTLSGTPSAVSPATNYTITGYNIGGSVQATTSIAITAPTAASALSALTLSNGTLSPVFASGTTAYSASVSNALTSMKVIPTAATATSTITVNGKAVTSGTASAAIPLAVGQNTITIVVKATGGSPTTTYTVLVTRQLPNNDNLSALTLSSGAFSPAFAAATLNYTATVTSATTSVTVTPTATVAGETITVNGTAVTSGTASGAIALNAGANKIIVNLIAADGVTTKNYVITVTQTTTANANLSAYVISAGTLTPVFAAATTSYTASVANTVTSITVTPTAADAGATIKVRGTVVASGSTSAPIALSVGANTINTVVTSGGTTKTYVLTVTRAAAANANLAAFVISAGTLTPAFAAATTSYTATVTNTVTSITVTPTAADPNATIKVRGTLVASGSASAPIALAVGANTINTIVTTGGTTKTYTLTVTRVTANDADLSAYQISAGVLTPAFAAATTSYTVSVANAVTTIEIIPTAADPAATVKVRGTEVASGSASAPIALSVGANTINTIVTAKGGATKTYALTVTRAAGGADSFVSGISVSEPVEAPTLAEDGIQVHQGVSPNGDGVNDVLRIENISQYPDNRLSIMNRNGQLIFEAKGYDNSSKVFDGHSSKNGQMQLPGTYFYQLDYMVSGITKHKTGFIVLKY